MAIYITDDCINCGACEPECPNNAIYEGGIQWAMKDGTNVKGPYTLEDGTVVDANDMQVSVSHPGRLLQKGKQLHTVYSV